MGGYNSNRHFNKKVHYPNRYVYKPKEAGTQNGNNYTVTKGNNSSPEASSGETNGGKNNTPSQTVSETPPNLEKVWKVSSENLEELKRSANKYSVLAEDGSQEKEVESSGRI